MRVLQLIDSLRSGGAEKMSVTYANALAKRIDGSFLCCTRMEGLFKKQISPEVGYLFLNKKRTLDLQAFLKLRKFVKANKIDLIQAHSSSWFLALMVKISLPQVKLVWHDHYGRELNKRKSGLLKYASKYFDGIIAVNKDLEVWSKNHLNNKKVIYIRNFLLEIQYSEEQVKLKGGAGFKIICLANLRPQKDHLNLLEAFLLLNDGHPELSLHLVGKEEQNAYAESVKGFIRRNNLSEKVFLYNEQENVSIFLEQADLGVLASASEGLPIALLEYGRAGLPVVCTDVGECAEVVGQHGIVVPSGDSISLAKALQFCLRNLKERKNNGKNMKKSIRKKYSENAILPEVITFLNEILEE